MDDSAHKEIRTGRANLQCGMETVGGQLTLTTDYLVFAPHQFNVQRATERIELSQISRVLESWTKFLDLIPIYPNSLSVFLKAGREYRFVLSNRKAWAAAIDEHRST